MTQFKSEIRLNNKQTNIRFLPHRKHTAQNVDQLMLYWEIIAVSQIHTKHTNTLCGQNVKLLNVKLGTELHIKIQSVPCSKHTPSWL